MNGITHGFYNATQHFITRDQSYLLSFFLRDPGQLLEIQGNYQQKGVNKSLLVLPWQIKEFFPYELVSELIHLGAWL